MINHPKTCKVRVIVLDGVDWRYANERRDITAPLWLLAQEGCAAALRACAAPITPSAVCALLSGRDDGLGWFSGDRYATSQELIRTRPWFPELARNDMTTGLCNVPLTWPAFPMPRGCWMTSGFPIDRAALVPHSNRPWKFPLSMQTYDYPIEALVQDTGPGGTKDLQGLMAAEVAIVDWFLMAPRCDVEIIWLRATDSAGHHVWGTPAYDEVVKHACDQTARLAEGAENVIVISDHGFDATESPRCEAYHRTSHGKAALDNHLCGSHSEEGILFARGSRIFSRGVLREQKLTEVAGGIFDLLQVPPAPGMVTGAPDWSAIVSQDEASDMQTSLEELGYKIS